MLLKVYEQIPSKTYFPHEPNDYLHLCDSISIFLLCFLLDFALFWRSYSSPRQHKEVSPTNGKLKKFSDFFSTARHLVCSSKGYWSCGKDARCLDAGFRLFNGALDRRKRHFRRRDVRDCCGSDIGLTEI